MNRRDFLRSGAAAALAMSAGSGFVGADQSKPLIWSELLHLGQNMWGDTPRAYTPPQKSLSLDVALWNELTEKMSKAGLNMIVIDLGEGVRYESHPELAIEGSWTGDRLREELTRLRSLGLEPIPKLNFSSCHDTWLGNYSHMLSTPEYYKVCADLIEEVCALFDGPRFFHLGYDEENYENQATYDYIVVRRGELWWHDFLFFCDEVTKCNSRPWIWADYALDHEEEFMERTPKSVVLSNWYYGTNFGPDCKVVQFFKKFDDAGFDQIPCGSNWSNDTNFRLMVNYCNEMISKEHLLGYLHAPWFFTTPEKRQKLFDSVDQVEEMIRS